MSWKYFDGNCGVDQPEGVPYPESPDDTVLPEQPPWRRFLPREQVDQKVDPAYWKSLRQLARADERSQRRGKSFRVQLDENGTSDIIDAVNAAIHLRRPLLVTGVPGSGKTSLAYAIAYELQLGPVLTWPITARANLTEAEYRYDAIARLQDAQLDKTRQKKPDNSSQDALPGETDTSDDDGQREEGDLGDYIQLGPVGTAFLPSLLPRVLLIDEIDKSDLNLPNDLLNLFEEGEFEIPELARRKRRRDEKADQDFTVQVRTADPTMTASVTNGLVKCCEFPIVIMTSNGERDFPPAFYRRCLRVRMPPPTLDSLGPIVRSHFDQAGDGGWTQVEADLEDLIEDFLGKDDKRVDRATDQLLNAVYLMTRDESPSEAEMERLKKLLFKRLGEADG
jgi:MoxR-like ATPase